jgi:hypothetical protein
MAAIISPATIPLMALFILSWELAKTILLFEISR